MTSWLRRVGDRVLGRSVTAQLTGETGRLCREGRYREAIDLLAAAYDATGDARHARDLVTVRYGAALQGDFGGDVRDWPPATSDLFPDCNGIPEIPPADFDARTLASGIVCHGGLIVRGMLSAEEIERTTSCVRKSFAALDRYREGAPVAEDAKWYSRFEPREGARRLFGPRGFAEKAAGILGADSPATVHEVLKIAEAHGIVKAVETFLDERPAVSVMKTTLRIVPPTTGAGWHQDGAFLGDYVRSANMWIALSKCGDDAPSLDILPKRFDELVATGTEGAPYEWAVGDRVADREARQAGVEILHLDFEPGDVIFFDHMNLHRTGVRPGMTKERLAIEWWFFAPSRFPEDQIPLLA